MNKDKVYIEGYEIDTKVSSLGYREKKIQLMNGKIVIIDENFTHKSIAPQKVKVPQCVAGWIENCKRGLSLRQAISQIHVGIELDDWLMEVDADGAFANQETFARAWLDGYEVKEEKRYTVVMKETKQPLYYNAGDKKLFFSLGGIATNFTRKQLEEAGFRWVFDCPGIEIEEVE